MGGRIELESAVGQGARFSFELVLAQGQMPQRAKDVVDFTRVQHLASGQRVRALVVDDVAANRVVLEWMLTAIGVETAQADNGEQAVAAVREFKPDIVFMDIRMPQMSGTEALRRIEVESGEGMCKVVAVSASAFVHQRQEYLAAGFDDYIEKPYGSERIYAVLADLLGVAFEYEREEVGAVVEQELRDFDGLVLPEDLYRSLVEAARTHNRSRLDRGLDRLENLGEAEQLLAEHLRQLARGFNMKEVGRILEKIDGT